jgi:uncharacterized YigZ family protein
MSSKRIIPAEEIKSEFQVSNSKFISTASPAFSVEEAKLFIDRIKSTYNDANHNVPIYIIGHPPSTIEHSNDDGEPSGTAGRPALSVLRGSGLGDIAIVITRYFGGTKLGTGGLVRAYSDAVREVIKILPKAQKVPTVTAQFSVPYNIYELVQRLVSKYEGSISDQNFDVQATLTAQFIQDKFPEFSQKLNDISNGQISAEIIDSNPNTIIPL